MAVSSASNAGFKEIEVYPQSGKKILCECANITQIMELYIIIFIYSIYYKYFLLAAVDGASSWPIELDGVYYDLSNTVTYSWLMSEYYCEMIGGRLAKFSTATEQNAIQSRLATGKCSCNTSNNDFITSNILRIFWL